MVFKSILFSFFLVAAAFAPAHAATKGDSSAKEPKYKLRWLVAHGPYNLIKDATDAFAENIRKGSNGEMVIEIVVPKGGYAQDALTPIQAMGMLSRGEYELSQIYTSSLGEWDSNFWALDLPFLFRSHEHATKVLDGPIGEEMLASPRLLAKNMRGLGFTYSGGYRVIPTRGKPITKVEDFASLKLATMGSPVAMETMRLLKASVADIPKSAIPEALTKGSIDGFESTYTRFGGLPEETALAKTLNETYHSLHLTSILVNEQYFKGLPPKFQALLKREVMRTAHRERNGSVHAAKRFKRDVVKKAGVKVVTMPASEIAKLRALTAPMAKQFPQYFSHDLVRRIESAATNN